MQWKNMYAVTHNQVNADAQIDDLVSYLFPKIH